MNHHFIPQSKCQSAFERTDRPAIEIDSGRGNAHGIPRRAHSVLAFDYVDTPGHPTRGALDRVLAFFDQRLRT